MTRGKTLLGAVLVLGLMMGTVAAIGAQDSPEADGRGIAAADGCYRKRLSTNDTIAVQTPSFCRWGLCRLNLAWKGDPIGALNEGFAWGIDYAQMDRGRWTAGPAISIAGWNNPSNGRGRNGNGEAELLMAGQTVDGSFIQLMDDLPGVEDGGGKFVLTLSNTNTGNPSIEWVEFWACQMGDTVLVTDG